MALDFIEWINARIDFLAVWQLLIVVAAAYVLLRVAASRDRDKIRASVIYRIVMVVIPGLCVLIGSVALLSLIPLMYGRPTLERISAAQSGTTAVIFVHGWRGDAESWMSFPTLIQHDVRFGSSVVYGFRYPSYLNRRGQSMTEVASILAAEIARLPRHVESVYVVAHSAGGALSRRALLQSTRLSVGCFFRGIVSVASPLRGSTVGTLAALLGISEGFADDLAPGSGFLMELEVDWNAFLSRRSQGCRPVHHCIAAEHDEYVGVDSAHYLCDRREMMIGARHIDSIKPVNADDERYRLPVSLLLDAMER